MAIQKRINSMFLKLNNFYLTVLFVLMLSNMCFAQFDEQKAKELVKGVRCASSVNSKQDPLRLIRREDLEDQLFSLQEKIVGKISKAAYIFEVRTTGYFILSPSEVVYISSVPSEPYWLAAISTQNGQIFPLLGCKDAESSFRDLIALSKIKVNSVFEAETFTLLRYQLIEDSALNRFIHNPRQLKHEIEDYFFDKLSEKQAAEKFQAWWRGFEKTSISSELGLKSKKENESYSTSLTWLSANKGVPELRQRSLEIFKDGVYQEQNSKVIFPSSFKN